MSGSRYFVSLFVAFLLAAGAEAASEGTTVKEYSSPDEQLGSLIEILLEENPGIRSAWAESEARYSRIDQAVSLPDPTVSYRVFVETPETRVGPQEHSLEISQGIPWNSKRRLQGEQARLMADGSTWQATDRERVLVAGLKKTYFEAAYLQEAILVLEEEKTLLERFEQIALTRYSTGKGIQQSVVKVQADISRLEERKVGLREKLRVLQQRMADLIGRPETNLALDPITLPMNERLVRTARTVDYDVDAHPAVRAVQDRIQAGETWVRRRTLEKRPDFKVGLGYTLVGDRSDPAGVLNPPIDNGNDILGLTFGVTIPLYRKRIHAGITEAEQTVRRDQEALESVRDDLEYQLQQAATRMQSDGERAGLFEKVIIPQAEQSLASAESAYSTGGLGFLDLLDAERILFQARLSYHRLVSDFWSAAAELEEAIGRPFPSMNEEPTR